MSTQRMTLQEPASIPSRRQLGWAVGAVLPLVAEAPWLLLCRMASFEHPVWSTWAGLLLGGLVLIAAVTDARSQRIPNWVTYCSFCWALLINLLYSLGDWVSPFLMIPSSQLGGVGLGNSLLGAIVCFTVMLFAYRLSGSGAGDVKLATAIGAFVGLQAGLSILLCSYLVAGLAIFCWFFLTIGPIKFLSIMWKKFGSIFLPTLVAEPSEDDEKLVLGRRIRLGPAFAVGTFMTIHFDPLFAEPWM